MLIEESKFELQSVGRLSATLGKKTSPDHWSNLLWVGEKARLRPTNMILWWDLVEKYESELESFDKKQQKEKVANDEEPLAETRTKTKKVKKVSLFTAITFGHRTRNRSLLWIMIKRKRQLLKTLKLQLLVIKS